MHLQRCHQQPSAVTTITHQVARLFRINAFDWPFLSFAFPPDYTCANREAAVAHVGCQNQSTESLCWSYFHRTGMTAPTVVHEWGHNLGLRHAGIEMSDGFNPVGCWGVVC